jgi:hypothetical protein
MSASLAGRSRSAARARARARKCTESDAMERADGEWCKLEMKKVALLLGKPGSFVLAVDLLCRLLFEGQPESR